MKNPLVSVIVLNWNGKKWLKKCLPSLLKVLYKPLEIIVVNNGSTDDSNEFLQKNFPQVKIVELKKNVGYAKANNIGVSQARGKYVILMNNDTEATDDFISILVDDMEKDSSIGVIQPQLRSMIDNKLLDSVCSYMTSTGFLYHYGYMKPFNRQIYHKRLYAQTIKGACMMMRKEEYQNLGGLDEDFECYVEEADLCHRFWLNGKKVMYEPNCFVYHWGGGDMLVMSSNSKIIFQSFRNRIMSYIKNYELANLIKLLIIHIPFCELFVLSSFLTGQFKKGLNAQMGLLSGFYHIPKMLSKRNIIQHNIRKISDKDISKYTNRNPRLSYFYYLFRDIRQFND